MTEHTRRTWLQPCALFGSGYAGSHLDLWSGDEILVLIDPEQSTSEVMALFLARAPVG